MTSPVPPPLPLEGPPAASSPDEGEDLVTVPSRPTLSERLSGEVLGGVLVLVAAALGITWANSPWSHAYEALSDWTVGPASWHLDLTLHAWASDGLLAVFFLVVGLELKRELVDGALRHVATAALPALTAVAGMVVPALVFLVTVALHPAATQAGDLRGWAVPTATDIAFALAVLAVVGRSLPGGVRLFLLTLAVVDDLLAIVVIAVVYTDEMHLGALAAAVPLLAAFAVAVRVRPRGLARFHRLSRTVWLLVVVALALAVWFAVHASGVHATIAGVALGLVVPARPRPGSHISLAERAEHAVRPWSAALAVPAFAFFAAGISLSSAGGIGEIVGSPVAWGVALGLVVGKPLGVLGAVGLLTRFTRLRLPVGVTMRDAVPLAFLTGIGFTVSLLVASLAYDEGPTRDDASLAVFVGSIVSALLGAGVLAARRRRSSAVIVKGSAR